MPVDEQDGLHSSPKNKVSSGESIIAQENNGGPGTSLDLDDADFSIEESRNPSVLSNSVITYDLAKPFHGTNQGDGASLWSGADDDKLSSEKEKFTDDQIVDRSSAFNETNYFKLEEDISSIVLVSPLNSIPFFFSTFMMAVQVTILVLCMESLIDEVTPGNILHVPVFNTVEENMAQALALMVSLFASRDIVSSLSIFDVDFGPKEEEAVASRWKWYMVNFTRFAIASVGLLVAFLFILQGTEVLDLFLDFAAVQFVSELDDIAFHLAKHGVLGTQMQDASAKVGQVQLNYRKKIEGRYNVRTVKAVGYSLLFCILLAPWIAVKIFQLRGFYFKADCQSFHIYFEENSFDACKVLKKQNRPCPEAWQTEALHLLQYEQFSDIYTAGTDENGYIDTENHRPIYYQRGVDNSDGSFSWGKISYCDQVNAWIFSIEGLGKGAKKNDCSWLIKSPETDAFSLDDVPEGDWVAWTGRLVETVVDITCIECEPGEKNAVGCNFNGDCLEKERTCDCKDLFLGFQCEVCTACASLTHSGDFWAEIETEMLTVATIRNETGIVDIQSQFNSTEFFQSLLKDETAVEAYDRQVYYIGGVTEDILFLLYSGSKYSIRYISGEVLTNTNGETLADAKLTSYLVTFHSFWETNSTLLFETGITREISPLGLSWFSATSNTKANFTFECSNLEYANQCVTKG